MFDAQLLAPIKKISPKGDIIRTKPLLRVQTMSAREDVLKTIGIYTVEGIPIYEEVDNLTTTQVASMRSYVRNLLDQLPHYLDPFNDPNNIIENMGHDQQWIWNPISGWYMY